MDDRTVLSVCRGRLIGHISPIASLLFPSYVFLMVRLHSLIDGSSASDIRCSLAIPYVGRLRRRRCRRLADGDIIKYCWCDATLAANIQNLRARPSVRPSVRRAAPGGTLDTTVRRPPLFYCDEARTAVTRGYRRTHRRPPESVAVIRQEAPVICVDCGERRRCVSGSPSASPVFFCHDTLQITTESDVCFTMVRFPCHTNCFIMYFVYHFFRKKNPTA